MISVVIPLYNKEKTIRRALQSVLRQTHPADEVVVVDDGSSDHSLACVREEMSHLPLRIISQSNQGVSAARNRGINEVQGDLVAFLDADDEWHEDFLATLYRLLQKHPQCDVAASSYLKISSTGNKVPAQLNRLHWRSEEGLLDNYFEVATYSEPPVNSSCLMAHTQAMKSIGGFPIGIGQGEDLLTWARLAVNSPIAYCARPLSLFYTEQCSDMAAPKRRPATPDVVGRELASLSEKHADIPYLKAYVAHWHKMRASIYLRLKGCTRQCRQEIQLSQQWNAQSPHLKLYRLLLLVPYRLRMNLLQHYHA